MTVSVELTPRQAQVLAFIRQQLHATGMPPTRAEIARALEFRSANAAEEHLRALARKGVLELVPGASRGMRLKEAVKTAMAARDGLPVVGRVAAGSPILAEQHIEAHYRLDPDLFHPRADYLLAVRGHSMRDAGILDGDLLAVHRTAEAHNGQIVVARLDDEVTVKRFQRRRERVQLLPANPEFAPIDVDLTTQSLTIEGISVGVIRRG